MTDSARAVIRAIQRDYVLNPQLGVARWFDEFDRALRRGVYDICHALVAESQEENFLSDGLERAYADSREGALLMCLGITHHLNAEYSEARQTYIQSRAIHARLHHPDGEGQLIGALSILERDERQHAVTHDLLEQVLAQPRVLGNSEIVLSERIQHSSAVDQRQAVLAAQQLRYVSPLLTALACDEPSVQAAAACALSLLDPGPNYATLAQMLSAPTWIVRWQAVIMLGRQTHIEELAAIWPAIHDCVSSGEPDAFVRCEFAAYFKEADRTDFTPQLAAWLADPDPDVRYCVVEALEVIGDRRAIPALERVGTGRDFWSNDVQSMAQQSLRAINDRYQLPRIRSLEFCRQLTIQDLPVQSMTIFLKDEATIHCVVTVAGLHLDAEVVVLWQHQGLKLAQQTMTLHPVTDAPLVEILPRDFARLSATEPHDLVHILGDPLPLLRGRFAASDRLIMTATRPDAGWPVGTHNLQLLTGGEVIGNSAFKIVERVLIQRVAVYSENPASSQPARETHDVLANAPRVFCGVTLTDTPLGLSVRLRLSDAKTNALIKDIREVVSRESQMVVFLLEGVPWQVGAYRLSATTEFNDEAVAVFNVVPRVDLVEATLHREGDTAASRLRNGEPARECQVTDTLICTVQLSPSPANFPVTVTWYSSYAEISAETLRPNNNYQCNFRRSPPNGEWTPGSYKVVVQAGNLARSVLPFQVVRPPAPPPTLNNVSFVWVYWFIALAGIVWFLIEIIMLIQHSGGG